MASVTEIFAAIAPELSADVRVDLFLELAAGQMSAPAWGARYSLAACYLAAHMLTLSPSSGGGVDAASAGPVVSRKAGDLEVSYAQMSVAGAGVSDALLMTTKYGREFVRMRRELGGVPMLISVVAT